MEIIPLASESLGARSMATFVQTSAGGVFIDPGISLCPKRFGLPPHQREEHRKRELWERIKEKMVASSIVILTHYHFDHFEHEDTGIYREKTLYVKHPSQKINRSQRGRASEFLQKIRSLGGEARYADGLRVDFGSTEIAFSRPVYHGLDAARGFVLEVCIEDDERFLFTSDVQGPALSDQIEFILQKRPETLYVDGAVTYMLGEAYPKEYLDASNRNLIRIIEGTEVERLIVDHHITRDIDYRDHLSPVYKAADEAGVSLNTVAEFLGLEPELLEARRRELYEGVESNGK